MPRLMNILVVIALLATAVGCGGEKEPTPEGTPAPSVSIGSPAAQQTTAPGATPALPATTPSPASEPTRPEAGGESSVLAVDAVPGGAIDATRSVTGAEPFAVDVVVVEVSSAYRGLQFKLLWDASVLSYVDVTYHEPIQQGFCQLPTLQPEWIYGGCAGQIDSKFTGPVATVQLRCVTSGRSPLHLVTFAEDPNFGTGVAAEPGLPFPSTLEDASVTCG